MIVTIKEEDFIKLLRDIINRVYRVVNEDHKSTGLVFIAQGIAQLEEAGLDPETIEQCIQGSLDARRRRPKPLLS